MKRKFEHGADADGRIGLAVLGWLAGDEALSRRFMRTTGLAPDTIRESARDPGFLGAVLDFVMEDEAVLVACAGALGLKPEAIAAAWRRLQPPEFDHAP